MIEITRDLKDIIISAYRYALTRHIYITELTCDYLMEHKELIDKRVKNILIKDTNDYLMGSTDRNSYSSTDYNTFYNFYQWLNELEVGEN